MTMNLRKQNNQNKEEQEEKKSNLENMSDEDFDLMLEEMLKERKENAKKILHIQMLKIVL